MTEIAEIGECRRAFEDWHDETYEESLDWVPERNLYKEFGHHCAWKGWTAAWQAREQQTAVAIDWTVKALERILIAMLAADDRGEEGFAPEIYDAREAIAQLKALMAGGGE